MSPGPRSFDVICAGEALWHLAPTDGRAPPYGASLRFRPGGGAVTVAMALARRGLRVGLATSLPDDTSGRALRVAIAGAGVDTAGVVLRAPRTGIVVLDGNGVDRQVVSYRDEEMPVEVPEGWAAEVLLLAGLSPVVANAAALCKAARAARRVGTKVVVDVHARWHLWVGRDPRATRMPLREADVVHCRTEDLAALGMNEAAVREGLRPSAALVVTSLGGTAWATGPFGEIGERSHAGATVVRRGAGDAIVAALCAELARAGGGGGDARVDAWLRALRAGCAEASAAS